MQEKLHLFIISIHAKLKRLKSILFRKDVFIFLSFLN